MAPTPLGACRYGRAGTGLSAGYMPTEGRRKTLNRLRQQAMPCSPHTWSGDVPDLPEAPACAPSSDSPEPDWYTESLRAWQNGQPEDRLTEEVITQLEALFRETPGHDSTTSSIDSLIGTMRTETKRVLAFLQDWKAKNRLHPVFRVSGCPARGEQHRRFHRTGFAHQ